MTNQSYTIFIVEDKKDQRAFLSEVLLLSGFEVIEAVDGLKALQTIRDGVAFDVMLLDHNLPYLSGMDLFKKIRHEDEFQRLRDTPIIFVSAYLNDEQVQELTNQGAYVLSKPLDDYNDIPMLIHEVLSKKDTD